MELRIDARPCDMGVGACAVPGYDADRLTDIEASREGRSLRIVIPPTPRNDQVLSFAGDPHAAQRFNAALHTAELSARGAVLLAGSVRLLASAGEGYTLEIREGGAQWAANAARRMFNTLGVPYRETLSPETILNSWTDSKPVKFLPVIRDEYPQLNSSEDLRPAERLLSVDDYHPFLHIATLLQTIFEQAGYRIESRFLDSEFFRSLYMSGAYPSRNTTAAAARMGFFARRLSPVTAAANSDGRVDADPTLLFNTVGNIVETATPQTLDADGLPIPELMNNGGCFSLTDKQIVFTPPTEVSVGFEYFIKYTTDHRILSRDRLTGFDSIYLGTGSQMNFTLANRYKDRRQEIVANHQYRVVVFDHRPNAQYRLTYTYNGKPNTLWSSFSTRSALATTPDTGVFQNLLLLSRTGTFWLPCQSDWALYDGYIGETGRTTVDLRVRTASELLSPTSPKYFNRIYFSGAENAMNLTLHKECSLRPRFLSSPGYGSLIEFADLSQHRFRQSVLLEAVAHLFNLRFYTDQATRTVLVEPADDFFGAGTEADWSDRTDFSQPVVRGDIAPEVHEIRSWGYLDGDGAVQRFDTQTGTTLGAWSFTLDSYAAKQGEQRLRNPLFCPTVSAAGHYLNAPSAQIMQVGDRDNAEEDGSNFTPRIVRFTGMHPLPGYERWGFPSGSAEYPLAAFHFAGDAAGNTTGDTVGDVAGDAVGDAVGEPFTLCFEDRDGVQGLHRHYDRQLAQESEREYITLSLRLAPHDIEALLTPGTGAPDIRSIFRIDTGAGVVRATLRRIGEYDPEAASVRCTFTRLTQD